MIQKKTKAGGRSPCFLFSFPIIAGDAVISMSAIYIAE
jgi:hypothetical protein